MMSTVPVVMPADDSLATGGVGGGEGGAEGEGGDRGGNGGGGGKGGGGGGEGGVCGDGGEKGVRVALLHPELSSVIVGAPTAALR